MLNRHHTRSLFFATLALAPLAYAAPSTQPSPKTVAILAKADPDMKAVLDALTDLDPKPIEMLEPKDARKQPNLTMAAMKVMKDKGMSLKPDPVADMDSRKLEVTDANGDRKIPVVVYTPEGQGPFPVIVYFHGGGFVIANIPTYDASIRALCLGSKAVVVAVDYRMAPEYKWPAAHDDAYLATQWVLSNASEIKGDSTKVAVAGESAGGNLATAVCLMAKDKGGKMPIHQLLIYPVTGNTLDTPSYHENAEAKPLNKAMMSWFFTHYTTTLDDAKNKYLAPLTASEEDLKGLPPATVLTAEIDPLRDDGKLYADKLKAAGIPTTYQNYEGVTHEFFGLGKVVAKAKAAEDFANQALQSAFTK